MPKWWMPDNGTASVGIHDDDGKWLSNAAYRSHADTLIAAHNADIDALTAERDEWKRLWTDHQRCAQCGDWGYGEICRVCVVIAERDELQRRLDAVVASLKPGEEPMRYMLGDQKVDHHPAAHLCARAVAIAEGRTP